MKKIIQISFITVLVVNCFAQNYNRYKIKSGKIEYTLTDNTEGTATLYWDDFGYKSLRITQSATTMLAMITKTERYQLTIGKNEKRTTDRY